ncbi:MAG: cell wall-binding repeat-containing protein [Firmicutes bacterium]|nr:cell wall-binding repeat-containing protein [Bacillota bacterium]
MSNIVTQSRAARFISVLLITLLIVTAMPVNMWQVHAASESTITTDKTTYVYGEPIMVSASSPNSSAWVGLYKADESPNDVSSFYWYDGLDGTAKNIFSGTTNSRDAQLTAGNYKVVLFQDGGYNIDKAVNITITVSEGRGDFLSTDKTSYDFDEAINVTVNGYECGSADWVALYKKDSIPGVSGTSFEYYYPKSAGYTSNIYGQHHQTEVTEAGEYTIYLLENNGYEIIDRVDITIAHQYGEWVFDEGSKTHKRACTGHADVTETKNCTFDDGVAVENGTKYTCTVCKGSYVESHDFEYTFNEADKTHTKVCQKHENCDANGTEACIFNNGEQNGDKVTYTCKDCKGSYTVDVLSTDKKVYDFGEAINVTVGTKYAEKDWVALFKKGEVPGTPGLGSFYYYYPSVKGSTHNLYDVVASDNQRQVVEPGTYIVYLFANDGYTVISSVEIEIQHNYGDWKFDAATKTHSRVCTNEKHAEDVDGPIACTFGEGEAVDGGFKYTCTVCNGSYVDAHSYTYEQNEGEKTHVKTCTAHKDCESNGTEECTFMKSKDDMGGTVYSCKFCGYTYDAAPISTDKKVYDFGEPINITVDYDYGAKDWVGLYKKGETPNAASDPVSFYYDYPSRIGSTFNIYDANWNQTGSRGDLVEDGEYRLYLCANDGFSVIAYTDITIKHDYTWTFDEETLTHSGVCQKNDEHVVTNEKCTWDAGVAEGNQTRFTCTVCGGSYLESHAYTYTDYDAEAKTHKKVCTKHDNCEKNGTEACEFESVFDNGTTTFTCKYCKGSYADTLLSSDKDSYTADDQILVTAKCENNQSWVGLYKKGDKYNPNAGGKVSHFWYYVVDQEAGVDLNGKEVNIFSAEYAQESSSVEATVTGEYTLVLFGDSGYNNVLATKDIYIDMDTSTATYELAINDKTMAYDEDVTVAEGEDVVLKVTSSTEGTGSAWVAYYEGKVGADANFADLSIGWHYLYDLEDGEWNLGALEAGDYTVIIFGNGAYNDIRIISYVTVEGERDPVVSETIHKAPTCTQPGVREVLYEGAEETVFENIPALGHDVKEWTYDAETKTHSGICVREYDGQVCGIVTEDCEFKAGEEVDGVITQKCEVCGGDYAEKVEKPLPPYTEENGRVAGNDRFDTALEAAEQLKKTLEVEKFENIIIASGMDYADALSGTYLAKVKNAPILLINGKSDAVMKEVAEYAKANLKDEGTIYILGGEVAVPAKFNTYIDSENIKIARLAGKNRYETNLAILQEAGVEGKDVLVCTGTNFADSLSASASGKAILLVGSTLDTKQKEFMGGLKDKKYYILGGTVAISNTLEDSIRAFGGTERISGKDRFETSVKFAEKFFENPKAAVMTYGLNFPDGLAGGVLAMSMDAPLILTAANNDTFAKEYTKANNIVSGVVLGGTKLISEAAAMSIFNVAK